MVWITYYKLSFLVGWQESGISVKELATICINYVFIKLLIITSSFPVYLRHEVRIQVITETLSSDFHLAFEAENYT